MLARLCETFRVVPSDIDERLDGPPTSESISALALAKARAVATRIGRGVVLGADTLVVVDGEGLGKPAGAQEARAMLRRLRGRSHVVITGVAVVDAVGGRAERTAVSTRVVMADVGDAAIDAYVAGGEPMDKAGAYAIQGEGAALVTGFDGPYSNVVGLPLAATAALLRGFGVPVTWPADPLA